MREDLISRLSHLFIEHPVTVFKYIENDPLRSAVIYPEESRHCIPGDPGRPVIGKMKLTCGDTAEGHGADMIFRAASQDTFITAAQILAEGLVQCAVYDGAHRVDHIFAGQIVPRRESGGADRLLIVLAIPHTSAIHNMIALRPELHPRPAVDRVVNAAVTGHKASQHLRIEIGRAHV